MQDQIQKNTKVQFSTFLLFFFSFRVFTAVSFPSLLSDPLVGIGVMGGPLLPSLFAPAQQRRKRWVDCVANVIIIVSAVIIIIIVVVVGITYE